MVVGSGRVPPVTRLLGRRRRWLVGVAASALLVSWSAAPVGAGDPVGQITEFTNGLSPNSGPSRIAAGPDGNLWFAPTGTITEFTTGLTPNSTPLGIAAGCDGNLWFTEAARPGRIGRITTAGVVTEFTTGLTPNAAPVGITPGPDTNLWFTEANDPGRVAKIGAGCVPAPLTIQPRFTG